MRDIYLDYNATTPVHPEVLEEMLPYYRDLFGNPSSIHSTGRKAREGVERARAQVAALLNCDPDEVVFTSCATESNNAAIKGIAAALHKKGNHIITTKVEHPSVLYPALYLEKFGYEVTCLDVDGTGMLDLQQLEDAITDKTILITAMLANNETGTIFPIRDIGDIARRRDIAFHCDAVQAVGKIVVDRNELNTCLLSLSGHKLYAPKGVGALVVRKGTRTYPYFHGGGQERKRRAGTENVAGIVGLGKACEIAMGSMQSESARLAGLRDRLEKGILAAVPEVRLNGHPVHRLPNTSNLSLLNIDSAALLKELDDRGIAVSSGSACSSGALKTSAGASAAGVPEAHLRFSLGRFNTDEDVDYVLEVLPEVVANLRGNIANRSLSAPSQLECL